MATRLTNKAFAKLSSEHAANCQNCNWQGHRDDLDPISDIWERTEEGDTVWAGDCPECGAMAFTVAEIERQNERDGKSSAPLRAALAALLAHADSDSLNMDRMAAIAAARALLAKVPA